MRHIALLAAIAMASCASNEPEPEPDPYPDWWPEEAKRQDISSSQVIYEYSFDEDCGFSYEIDEAEHPGMFDDIARQYLQQAVVLAEKDYFYTDELRGQFDQAASEEVPDWKLEDRQTSSGVRALTEPERQKLEAVSQRLLQGRSADEPLYATTYRLVSYEPAQRLTCYFNADDELVDSALLLGLEGDDPAAGDLDTIQGQSFPIAITLRTEQPGSEQTDD